MQNVTDSNCGSSSSTCTATVSATAAAVGFGKPYWPVAIAGNAMVRAPCRRANSKLRAKHEPEALLPHRRLRPGRPNRVNNKTARQIERFCQRRTAGKTTALFKHIGAACLAKLGTGSFVNRLVDFAASREVGVGRIDKASTLSVVMSAFITRRRLRKASDIGIMSL